MKHLATALLLLFSQPLLADDCIDCGRAAPVLQLAAADGPVGRAARAAPRGEMIQDDLVVCDSIERGSFKGVVERLREQFNTTLEDAYFRIRCGRQDLLGMVVENPADRFLLGFRLQDHFVRKLKQPAFFSRILLHEVDTRNILTRIDITLTEIRQDEELRDLYERKLLYMQKKYLDHLEQHPVPGSADVVAEYR